MVDYQFCRLQWIYLCRITSKCSHGVTHGCEIDYRGYTGKVLHQYPRWVVCDFARWLGIRIPLRHKVNIRLRDALAVFMAQQIFEKDTQRIRQTFAQDAVFCQRVQPENLIGPIADL